MSESLLVIVVALFFLAISKTILVTSVKPMSKNRRIASWIIIFFSFFSAKLLLSI